MSAFLSNPSGSLWGGGVDPGQGPPGGVREASLGDRRRPAQRRQTRPIAERPGRERGTALKSPARRSIDRRLAETAAPCASAHGEDFGAGRRRWRRGRGVETGLERRVPRADLLADVATE